MFLEIKPDGEAKPQAAVTLKPWQNLLLDAADLLEQMGWCQDVMSSGHRHCMLGAIATCAETNYLRSMAWNRLIAYMGQDPVNWNDVPGRTAAEVVAILRACATTQRRLNP